MSLRQGRNVGIQSSAPIAKVSIGTLGDGGVLTPGDGPIVTGPLDGVLSWHGGGGGGGGGGPKPQQAREPGLPPGPWWTWEEYWKKVAEDKWKLKKKKPGKSEPKPYGGIPRSWQQGWVKQHGPEPKGQYETGSGDPGGGPDGDPQPLTMGATGGAFAPSRQAAVAAMTGVTTQMLTGSLAMQSPKPAGSGPSQYENNAASLPTGSASNGVGWTAIECPRPMILVPVNVTGGASTVPTAPLLYHANRQPALDSEAIRGYGPKQLCLFLHPGRWFVKYTQPVIVDYILVDASNPAIIGRYLLEGGFLGSPTTTAVAVTDVSAQMVAANINRRYLILQNVGANAIVYRIGPTSTPAVFPVPVTTAIRGNILLPNAAGIAVFSGENLTLSAIQAICSTGLTSVLSIVEGI